MKNLIGPRLREVRYRSGKRVTQEALAARLQAAGLNLDRSAIAKIESQRRPVSDIEVVAVCRALGIKITELIRDEDI